MTTNYRRGRALEYRIRDDLRERGYLVVRSAGSKGAVDLMAVGNGDILLVQSKRDGWAKPSERAALVVLAEQYGALAIIATPGNPGIAYRHYTSGVQFTEWGNHGD
jgi:Holliday junction resolvase